MSLSVSRVNLLPTARALASGAPMAGKINRNLPPAHDAHAHGVGPRTDVPPSWATSANGRIASTNVNGELLELIPAVPHTRRSKVVRFSPVFDWFILRPVQFHISDQVLILRSAPSFASFQARRMHTTPSNSDAAARSSTTGVPDFSPYRVSGSGETNRTLSYFMVGSLGVLAASGAKSTVADILSNMAASADVLALAKIEVEMGSIPEGEFTDRFGCLPYIPELGVSESGVLISGIRQEYDFQMAGETRVHPSSDTR